MVLAGPEVRGAPARLWDVMLKPHGGVREILIHGPAGTGKSRGILEWLWWVATTFRGMRILIARKTRVSLTEAGLVTLEDQVIPAGHPTLIGPGRANRASYSVESTKSEIVLGGMDHPTRLYSTDWDIIYIQEAQELVEDEWERLRRGLRHFSVPTQILIGDCNPESPQHWLYKRMQAKKTEDWPSRHWDNPKWYSLEKKLWTAEGVSYIDSLARLTGVRRDRLLRGEWVAASGAVWDNFDTGVHVIDQPGVLPEETRQEALKRAFSIKRYFGSIDWGFAAAGTLQIWGVDDENRIYLVAEYYRSGNPLSWWTQKILDCHREFGLMCVVADPARPDAISVANDFLHQNGCRRMVWTAHNRRKSVQGMDMGGLDLVRHKLSKQKDGRPGIYLVRGSLRERDNQLEEQRKCTCLAEEIPGYVYLRLEDGKPSKEATDPSCDDHGCDALRYAACYIWMRDLSDTTTGSGYRPNTWGNLLRHDDPDLNKRDAEHDPE